MKNFKCVVESKKIVEGKFVICYGAGFGLQTTLKYNPWLIDFIDFVVDRDKKKIGKIICGLKVKHVNNIKFIDREFFVIVTCWDYLNIRNQLLSENVDKGDIISSYIYDPKIGGKLLLSKLRNPDHEKLNEIRKLLADKKSRDILNTIVKLRASKSIDYSDIATNDQYFIPEVIDKINKAKTFLDCGVAEGDEIIKFRKFNTNAFITAIEPDPRSYKELVRKFYQDTNVLFKNVAISNAHRLFNFKLSNDFESSLISNKGDHVVNGITVDSLKTDFDFIKMDIEGHELNALKGAKQSILRCRPTMAICVYHRSNHIVSIPAYIRKICRKYEFYLRHHSIFPNETVLYCVPH